MGTMMDVDTVKAQAAQNLYPEYFIEDYVYVGVEGGGLAEDISSVRIYFETAPKPTDPPEAITFWIEVMLMERQYFPRHSSCLPIRM